LEPNTFLEPNATALSPVADPTVASPTAANPAAEPKPFAELGLSPKVMAAIEAAGYTTATPIQSQAIPVALSGRDVLGIAQTGTGKTAAFVLPMITRLENGRARARMPRSLILAPTRELAAQVEQSFDKYGINHKLTVALLIGGTSMDEQVKKLDRGVDVLIATPGRMLDLYNRGRLMLMGVEILVIDEADRMLDMGFIPDIEKICTLLPPKKQTLFFSATMPTEITRLVNTFLKDPVRIEVARPATTAKTIVQQFRFCPDGEDFAKREVLRELIKAEGDNVKNAIIFCNRKKDVAILLKSLTKHGYNAGALHGDMDQKARMETLDAFRAGKIAFLAASDVAARGLDIPEVSHVFNFDVPWAGDDYVHRIGRTGRAGRAGTSLTLVAPDDLKLLKDIEKATAEQPTWIGTAPTPEDFSDGAKKKRRAKGGKPPERGADRSGGGGGDRNRSGGGRPARPADRAASPNRQRRDARPGSNAEEPVERRPPRRVREPLAAVQMDASHTGSDSSPPPRQDRADRGPVREAREDGPVREPRGPREQGGDGRNDRRPPRRQPQRPAAVAGPIGDQPDVAGWPSLTPDGPVGDGAVPRRVPPRDHSRDGGREGGRDGAPRERTRRDGPAREPRPTETRQSDARPSEDRSDEARQSPRRDRGADRPERTPARPPERASERPAERSGSDRPSGDRSSGDRPRNDRRPHRGDQSDGPPTGFTDNVPAFLRKPAAKTKSD
jgi:superfamily II DNA/RNA helicase